MSLIIPMGLPGCGKSTWASRLFGDGRNPTLATHSTDDIRVELTGNTDDMSRNEDVFSTFHERIAVDLEDGLIVYADATNLRDFAREKLRTIADQVGVDTHLAVFTNVEQAVKRNLERERVVPEEVMTRFIDQYERALLDIVTENYESRTYISALY